MISVWRFIRKQTHVGVQTRTTVMVPVPGKQLNCTECGTCVGSAGTDCTTAGPLQLTSIGPWSALWNSYAYLLNGIP